MALLPRKDLENGNWTITWTVLPAFQGEGVADLFQLLIPTKSPHYFIIAEKLTPECLAVFNMKQVLLLFLKKKFVP